MWEKPAESFFSTFAVEDYLGSADFAVGYILLVHEIEGFQNLLSKVL